MEKELEGGERLKSLGSVGELVDNLNLTPYSKTEGPWQRWDSKSNRYVEVEFIDPLDSTNLLTGLVNRWSSKSSLEVLVSDPNNPNALKHYTLDKDNQVRWGIFKTEETDTV